MSKRILLTLLSLLLLPAISAGQGALPPAWRHYIEHLQEESQDEAVEDLTELYETYHDQPLNINDTTTLLEPLVFINDVQRICLKAYIQEYGQLISINELHGINFFDSLTIELLRPLVVVQPIEETRYSHGIGEMFKHSHSNLVTGIGGTIEQARGYRDNIYEGNNMRMMWRYYFKYHDKIQLQLSGDKDPGEAFFSGSQKQGFDFYGYSLMLNDIGKGKSNIYLQRVILGQYHLQFGQGLTLWSGYGVRSAWGASIYRSANGIRPSGAFTEYGYLNGGGATVALAKHLSATVFYSLVNRAATLPTNNDMDYVQSIYNSGYHRTQTEINKQDQLKEQLWGGHIEYHQPNIRIGMTAVATHFDKSIQPAATKYNELAFQGSDNFNAGIDFAIRHRRLIVFGEGSICSNNYADNTSGNISPALLLGSEFVVNNLHRLCAQIHYYSPTYHNFHATALGQSSTPRNELGGHIYYQGLLPWRSRITASAGLFYHPEKTYQAYAPSYGQEYRLSLAHSIAKNLTANLRYRYKEQGQNITPATLIDDKYLLEQTYRHQILCDVEYSHDSWQLTTRIGYAHFHGQETPGSNGLLLYQDIQYTPSRIPLSLSARVALFDVDDYEARLYTIENDFIYQYNGNIYQNEGYRCYLVMRYEISKNWNIGIKYGITAYTDRDTFGSGYEQIDSNHRQQWRIQMRIKW